MLYGILRENDFFFSTNSTDRNASLNKIRPKKETGKSFKVKLILPSFGYDMK